MTVKELKDRLNSIPDDMTVCVFANCEVYDILDTQIWTDLDDENPEFELGCGFCARNPDKEEE